jgi:ABC-2 type transport system ATP-binding protein
MTEAVVVEDVTKRYGGAVALDGVSLTVPGGAVCALLGPNGAGKTTLVRAITGTTAVEGRVEVFGAAPQAVVRSRLGVLPQEFTPPERLSARELLGYYAGLYETARDPDALLETVGLTDAGDTRYEDLSGGQKRRTTLGVALVNDPDLLVLDEPTAGIDPAGRRRVRDIVADLADRGTTVLITTHDIDEAERLADRAVLLADGRVVAADSPGALVREYGGDPRLVVEAAVPAEPTTFDRSATVVDGDLVFEGVDPGEVDAVLNKLPDAGVTYDGFRWARPDLEDVYLERTGGWDPDRAGRGSIANLPTEPSGAAGTGDTERRRLDPDPEASRPTGGRR